MLDRRDKFKTKQFENGLTVYSTYFDRPWEYVVVLINAGLRQEKKKGLAHLLEHVVFDDFASRKEFDNATTGLTSTYLKLFSPVKNINAKLLEDIADSLFREELKEEVIEREKRVIYQEYKRRTANKINLKVEREKTRVLYPDSWAGGAILGTPESVEKITKKDLESFRNSYYSPKNISIIFAGGLKIEKSFEIISKVDFSGNKQAENICLPKPQTNPDPPVRKEMILRYSDYQKNPEENSYTIGKIVKLPGSYSETAVKLLRDFLNHLLYKELRLKKQWVYSVSLALFNFGIVHELNIHCSFSSVSVEEVNKGMNKVLEEAKENKSLFNSQKNDYLNELRMNDYNVWDVCARAKDDIKFYGKIRSVEDMKREVENVDFKDIRRLIEIIQEQSWKLFVVS